MNLSPTGFDGAVAAEDGQTAGLGQHDEFLVRVGHMTRALHESLRGLGLDKLIERAAQDIPDARDRLDYVARMSEQAAQRVLNATDAAGPLQDTIEAEAGELHTNWQRLMDSESALSGDYRALADSTMRFLQQAKANASGTKGHLMDIMMAQDFQDLTGQVIKKVTGIAQSLEQQLVQLLIDFAPAEVKREVNSGLLNGPQINPEGNAEVVSSQSQVDDLLDSLGF